MTEQVPEKVRRGSYRRYSPVKRTRTIGVRLTEEEYGQVRQAAQRDMLTPSSWVGKLAMSTAEGVLGGTAPSQSVSEGGLLVDRETLFGIVAAGSALAPIGNNINQIAKHLNAGFREGFQGGLAEAFSDLAQLRSFVGGFDGRH